MRLTTIALAAIALLLLAAVAVAPATRVDLARSSVPVEVASTAAPSSVSLGDILIGRYQPGFFPALDGAVLGSPRPGRVVWLRLSARLPDDAGERRWYVRLERAPVDRVAVLLPDAPEHEVAESRFFRLGSWDARWPDGFVMALPSGIAGDVRAYVRVEGHVDADLRPQLIDGAVLAEREAAAQRLFALVYGALLAALLLGVAPAIRRAGGGGATLAAATLLAGLTIALINDHLPPLLRALVDPWLGGGVVFAATVLLAGVLLLVAREQSGLKANSGTLALWYQRIGLALVVLALFGLYVPAEHTDLLRRVAEFIWSQAWLLVLVAFALDRRRLRSLPIVLMILLIAALAVRAFAASGAVPPSALALYGYQLLMAVLLLSLVLLPWLRGLPVDARRLPMPAAEPSPSARWAEAEARMVAAISTALRHGGADEADWVVSRRLIDALKPLLDADAVAVGASTLHGEDHVLAEPSGRQPVFAALMRDRARMLRSLLRLGAPQQLALPGGEGGASQVAIVPYLLSDSGWKAVFIERRERGFDADELSRAGALVAAARRVAGVTLSDRDAAIRADLDPVLEVLNADALQRDLRTAFERCRDAGEAIALLRIPLAGEGGFELRARAVINALEALEALPSHLLGRPGPDELWIVLPRLDVPAARAFAEALQQRLAPETEGVSGLAPAGLRPPIAAWRVGVSAIVPGERVPRPMIERAGEAVNRTSAPGAPAVQAVVPSLH